MTHHIASDEASAAVVRFGDVLLEAYSFRPDLSVPKHSHEDYQIGLTLTDPGEYGYRGTRHAVPVRSVSVIHPGEMHTGRSISLGEPRPTETRILYVPAHFLPGATGGAGLPFFPDPILEEAALVRRFLRLHSLLSGPGSRLEQDSRLLSSLSLLVARHAHRPPPPPPCPAAPPAVQRAHEYLHTHYDQDVPLQTLAEVADLTPNHLCAAFRRRWGLPPHAYQTQVRVARAKALLIQGVPPGQVAAETGFSHQSHFGWHFRRLVGVTPGRYLRSNLVIRPENPPPQS